MGEIDANGDNAAAKPAKATKVIAFCAAKDELCTISSGFKMLARRLRTTLKPVAIKDELTRECIGDASILVFGAPREKFSAAEFDVLADFLSSGGGILMMLTEGGELGLKTNVNYLLEQFGISANSDCVIRNAFQKYMHPKEVLIEDGVRSPTVASAAVQSIVQKASKRRAAKKMDKDGTENANGFKGDQPSINFPLVYANGATLRVQSPGIPLLCTGKLAYPASRPIVAAWQREGAGRLVVSGSVHLFRDEYLDKESNAQLMDFILHFLLKDPSIELAAVDDDDFDTHEYDYIPDTGALANRLRACLQVEDPLPTDFHQLLDLESSLITLEMSLVPDAIALYSSLGIEKTPLALIKPQFETPLPPFQPALFPPPLRSPATAQSSILVEWMERGQASEPTLFDKLCRELKAPPLELFDLEEEFVSERARLAQLTNKCIASTDEDISYFLVEAASYLGLSKKLQSNDGLVHPKAVMSFLLREICRYKSSDAG